MHKKILRICAISAIILPMVVMVGCSSVEENNQHQKDQVSIEHQSKPQQTQQPEVNKVSFNDVKTLFDGVWVIKNAENGENIYTRFTKDRYEYHTNKKVFYNGEIIKDMDVDDSTGVITFKMTAHDVNETTMQVKIVDKNTIAFIQEDGSLIEYVKVLDKGAAARDLIDVWKKDLDVYSKDTEENSYGLDIFLGVTHEELKMMLSK